MGGDGPFVWHDQIMDAPSVGLALSGIRSVMVFSDSPSSACAWWAQVMCLPANEANGFHWIDMPGGIELGFHPADPEKNAHGRSTVPYWRTPDLDESLAQLVAAGAAHHRGPLDIENGRRIAQIVDPFGTVFGLDETWAAPTSASVAEARDASGTRPPVS